MPIHGSPFPTRRDFLRITFWAGGGLLCSCTNRSAWVNDVHSRLTATRVAQILRPASRADLLSQARAHLAFRGGLSLAGGRHSMGAQAFGTDSMHLDLTGTDQVTDFDSSAGIVETDPGTTWPHLMQELDARQPGISNPWCIRQKQTGADQLTLGGALASNIHGRGLAFAPIVQDIESFTLLTATGDEIRCSREENPDWFALVIGGYGMFGIITSVRLRLMRRQTVRRVVSEQTIETLSELVEKRIGEGFTYGDFQFSCAPETDGFLRHGIFSSYCPVPESLPGEVNQKISVELWKKLITLAHTEKAKAFEMYRGYYLKTDGQLYASDRQQMSTYLPDYHEVVAEAIRPSVDQSLVITELYVPRARLAAFMEAVRNDLREHRVDLVYGVVRWIEPDHETFLPWARGRMACVIFNLNVRHDAEGKARAAQDFRRLIDRALEQVGAYYLTYHRHATRSQVEAAYPKFPQLLAEKEKRDPRQVWRSDWFRHYQQLFS